MALELRHSFRDGYCTFAIHSSRLGDSMNLTGEADLHAQLPTSHDAAVEDGVFPFTPMPGPCRSPLRSSMRLCAQLCRGRPDDMPSNFRLVGGICGSLIPSNGGYGHSAAAAGWGCAHRVRIITRVWLTPAKSCSAATALGVGETWAQYTIRKELK